MLGRGRLHVQTSIPQKQGGGGSARAVRYSDSGVLVRVAVRSGRSAGVSGVLTQVDPLLSQYNGLRRMSSGWERIRLRVSWYSGSAAMVGRNGGTVNSRGSRRLGFLERLRVCQKRLLHE